MQAASPRRDRAAAQNLCYRARKKPAAKIDHEREHENESSIPGMERTQKCIAEACGLKAEYTDEGNALHVEGTRGEIIQCALDMDIPPDTVDGKVAGMAWMGWKN
jgi:hypothetical protein